MMVAWPLPGCSRRRRRMRRWRTRWRGSRRRPWKNAHLTAIRTSPAAAIRMRISMTWFSWGRSVAAGGRLCRALDVGEQDAAGGAGVTGRPRRRSCSAIPDTCVERQRGQVVALAGQGDQQVLLAVACRQRAVGAVAVPGLAGGGWRWGGAGWRRGGLAAGGDGAFLDDPAAEPGRACWTRGEGQAQQPQEQAAGDGQRGGLVVRPGPGRWPACGPGPRRGRRR